MTLLRFFWNQVLGQPGYELLPIEVRHAAQVSSLPFHHGDPFDRLIAAQALVEGVLLVSIDKIFDAYGVDRVW
ncbi:MAG: type II toxin-antitoxin system VapC family toxin [Planctomycetota bacterium]